MMRGIDSPNAAWVDLYWLPLGAGGRCVRFSGRIYEYVTALRRHRSPHALYHGALKLRHHGVTYAIEMGPVWNVVAPDRGTVCQGPVGARWLGGHRMFRYEVRCWPGGHIPDLSAAVDSPQRVSEDAERASAVLSILRRVPPLTWGRDELDVGDMWNSNSIVSWVLASSGHDMTNIHPPADGHAPGWSAGLALAARGSGAGRTVTSMRPGGE